MRAGRLRHRIRLETPTVVKGTDGAGVKTWANVAEVNASVDALSGREYFLADRDMAQATYKITLREVPGTKLDPRMRAIDIDSGAIYEFVAALPSHARNVYIFAAKTGGQLS